MSGHLLLIACLLAICLPILSVQLPRTALLKRRPSNDAVAEKRSTLLSRPPSLRRRPRAHMSQTDGALASPSTDSGAEGAGAEKVVRKPWDPPFPKSAARARRRWLVLPDVGPERRDEGGEEEREATEDKAPADAGSESGAVELRTNEVERQDRSTPADSTEQDAPSRNKPSATSILCLMLGILGILLCLVIFAILIAHCLAWFLVYKTEARLGEARRGLLKGGEMRLCLCAS